MVVMMARVTKKSFLVVVLVAQNCCWKTDIMAMEDIMARKEIPVVEMALKYHRVRRWFGQ